MRRASKSPSRSEEETPEGPPSREAAEDRLRRARAKAFELLTGRELTERQLYDRLTQRGFDDVESKTVVQACVEMGLVDDSRVAEMLVSKFIREARSRLVIRQKMMLAGLSRELVDSQLQRIDADQELEHAQRQAARLTSRTREKAEASLRRKGFSGSQARAALGVDLESD